MAENLGSQTLQGTVEERIEDAVVKIRARREAQAAAVAGRG